MTESPIQSIRRSVTLPTKLNPAQRGSSAPRLSENVVFYHPSAKIVHFAPRALVPIPSSSAPSDFDYPVDTIETLPWCSATERTVATAPLRLEKVHGLTVFLKCGNVVHAILKNSQCWCVDGVSKFVLRIRPLTYYRIEIPSETEEDREAVRDLKAALPTVLRYEVTPCPFKRSFTVEIPEEAMAPRRKKAWRPKDRRESGPAVMTSAQVSPSSSVKSEWIDSASTGDDTDGNMTDDSGFTSHRANSTTLETIPDDPEVSPSINTLEPPVAPALPRRSVTETPQTFTSLLAKFEATSIPEDENDSPMQPALESDHDVSFSSSPESFHSADLPSPSESTSTHPTPVEGHEVPENPEVHAPCAANNDIKVQDQTTPPPENYPPISDRETSTIDAIPASVLPTAPTPTKPITREGVPMPSLKIPSDTEVSSQPLTKSPASTTDFNHMSVEFRRRAQATRQRDVSPMPPRSAIYQPPPTQDAASILSKALTLVLVPPISLFIILMHVAARVVISPALSTPPGEPASKVQPSGHDSITEDDFSFPLEPEISSEYEDAEISKKLDPWDLD
ncbi:hypothetical protein NUU61_000849 [Penicillium alfredii]|uniref:Inheritance of peroxisomes protein 1 n=1 Tax=Penicillium alfredii TaxID=1506179 RepID=A0A9W9GAB4_9EURO|nr:uncharacterized protein NUU61_000849 [Penicillium alfredii]KAJ5115090.1 hypothetical protein NUU61_000849 [Penicillium alfredii]